MTADLDLDKILGAMESDAVGSNAMSIMDMLEAANKVMSQVTSLMDKFEKMGLKPLLVRGAGAKLGIDAETPLNTDNVVVPATPGHAALFAQLNTMNEEQLREMFMQNEETDKPTTNTD